MRRDFNLFDAYRIFDTRSTGQISVSDIKLALYDIGLMATYDEVELFVNRYDKDRNGRLSFSEFCDAIIPKDFSLSL